MMLKSDLNITYVPRWCIVPLLRPQSVAEHSWRVARIALEIVNMLRAHKYVVEVSAVLEMALMHDVDEAITGDIPSPQKRSTSPSNLIEWVVDVADKAEALAYIKLWGARGAKYDSVVRYMEDKVTFAFTNGLRWLGPELINNIEDFVKSQTEGV